MWNYSNFRRKAEWFFGSKFEGQLNRVEIQVVRSQKKQARPLSMFRSKVKPPRERGSSSSASHSPSPLASPPSFSGSFSSSSHSGPSKEEIARALFRTSSKESEEEYLLGMMSPRRDEEESTQAGEGSRALNKISSSGEKVVEGASKRKNQKKGSKVSRRGSTQQELQPSALGKKSSQSAPVFDQKGPMPMGIFGLMDMDGKGEMEGDGGRSSSKDDLLNL